MELMEGALSHVGKGCHAVLLLALPGYLPKEQSEDPYIRLQASAETNMTYVCFLTQWSFNESDLVLPCGMCYWLSTAKGNTVTIDYSMV